MQPAPFFQQLFVAFFAVRIRQARINRTNFGATRRFKRTNTLGTFFRFYYVDGLPFGYSRVGTLWFTGTN